MTSATTVRSRNKICFGDFQTPQPLADDVCRLLRDRGLVPNAIIEPTCGVGSFVLAAVEAFPSTRQILGFEINSTHLAAAADRIRTSGNAEHVELKQQDFYRMDWGAELARLPEPILVIGNPPWVTSATQGSLHSKHHKNKNKNLPTKSNFDRRRGIDAITGQANFDVSEWMLSQLFDGLNGRQSTVAMLCKTTVARRVLASAWRRQLELRSAELHAIDARAVFGAAVNACLLIVEFAPGSRCDSASVYPHGKSLGLTNSSERIGWRDGQLIANLDSYSRRRSLSCASATQPLWRSGVKHDCSAVMELVRRDGRLWNRLEELVDVEPGFVFPLLKSGDIAAGRTASPRHWLILPQRFVGDDTGQLERTAPRLWRYLLSHGARLDARRSSIYRRQPRFAVFGIGEYTFAPWKVVVSGLAKRLQFSAVGPLEISATAESASRQNFRGQSVVDGWLEQSHSDAPASTTWGSANALSQPPISPSANGLPWVLDDASYFLPCPTQQAARGWAQLLNSAVATEFFSAFIFWDAKRPVTAEILRKLDLRRLALDTHLSQGVDRATDDAEQIRVG